jgi:enoyl-CoA hydratase/carnithine racemase
MSRPTSRNAISLQMCETFEKSFEVIGSSTSDVRALIITGSDLAFSAGKDLKASLHHSPEESAEYYRKTFSVVKSLLRLPIPILISMERICLGLGLEIALTGDIRVAGKSTQLGFPEINLSLFPGCGGAVMLPALLGNASIASDWILTGRRVQTEEAKHVGLLARVVDDGEAFNESLMIAKELIKKNRTLLVKTKEIVRGHYNLNAINSKWMHTAEKYRKQVAEHPDHLAALSEFTNRKK